MFGLCSWSKVRVRSGICALKTFYVPLLLGVFLKDIYIQGALFSALVNGALGHSRPFIIVGRWYRMDVVLITYLFLNIISPNISGIVLNT